VRFATHYRFRPDFFEGADPECKNLVGYFKYDLTIAEQLSVADPERLDQSLANLIANVGSC
jgi:hypothetical protein